jgi:signal transduction histidine kinase
MWAVTSKLQSEDLNPRLARAAEVPLGDLPLIISAAVHELKGPLQVLSMALHTIDQRTERGEAPDQRSLDRVHRQLRRLARVLEDLGDAGRLAGHRLCLTLETLDLRTAVEAAVAEVPPARRPDVRLHESSLQGPLLAVADRARVHRLLCTLLDRAGRLSREGTPIIVTLFSQRGDHERAAVRVSHEGEALEPNERELLAGVPADPEAVAAGRAVRPAWHTQVLEVMDRLAVAQGGTMTVEPPHARPGEPEILTLYLPLADERVPRQ